MKIAVVGSRNWQNKEKIQVYLSRLPDDVILVSGGARGVDTIAQEYAQNRGWQTEIYEADWGTRGKQAGMIRNSDIVNAAERVIAFWDGKSKGTKNTIDKALKAEHIKQVMVFKE